MILRIMADIYAVADRIRYRFRNDLCVNRSSGGT